MLADDQGSRTGVDESFVPHDGVALSLQEAAAWDLFDVNVRVGPSGVHGELALEPADLLKEMDDFYIRSALASHWAAEEYDAATGNESLARVANPRFTPAWGILPQPSFIETLAARNPLAVRITPGLRQHSYSLGPWCSGPMFEYLQDRSIVSLISRSDITWDEVATLLENFPRLPLVLLDTGYRADRYLFPLLDRFPSLHFDTATYLAHRQLESVVEQRGSAQLLFGSRLPLFTPSSAIGVLASARIAESDKRAIAGDNLRRLLTQAKARTGGQA